jgi:hypothetical protein
VRCCKSAPAHVEVPSVRNSAGSRWLWLCLVASTTAGPVSVPQTTPHRPFTQPAPLQAPNIRQVALPAVPAAYHVAALTLPCLDSAT